MRRHGGLTGIRMYTAGVDYHRNAFTEGGETSDPREYKGFNPVRLMMRQAAKLGHKGKKAELSLGRGEQYRQERENAMKQQARQKPKDENFTVPKQLELGPLGLDDDDIN
jgi:hypothetical protein